MHYALFSYFKICIVYFAYIIVVRNDYFLINRPIMQNS